MHTDDRSNTEREVIKQGKQKENYSTELKQGEGRTWWAQIKGYCKPLTNILPQKTGQKEEKNGL